MTQDSVEYNWTVTDAEVIGDRQVIIRFRNMIRVIVPFDNIHFRILADVEADYLQSMRGGVRGPEDGFRIKIVTSERILGYVSNGRLW